MLISEGGLRRYIPAELFQPLVWLGLFLGFSALPVATVYATRSAPLFLALACLTLLADEYRRNPRLTRLRALAHGSLRKPMVLPLIAMAALGGASAAWSAVPEHTFRTALQFAGAFLLGVGWVSLISRFRRQHVLPFLAGGLTFALLALPVELLLPAGLRSFFTSSTLPFEHNRTIVQLSMLATLFVALAALRADMVWRVWAVVLVLGHVGMTLISESQAVFAYWLVVGLAAVPAGLAPRPSLAAVGLAAGILMAAFPWLFLLWQGEVAEFLAGFISADFASSAHIEHRLLIWTEFARIVAERPWFGWGMESERAIDLTRILDRSTLVDSPHHPHSVALELWTGLGAAGVVLGISVLIGFLRLVARYGDVVVGWATCLFAGTFAVWLISHGAWEHWWLTILSLSFGTLLALDHYPKGEGPIAAS